jgi:hypothetical protein
MGDKEELPGPVILDVAPISCSMTMTRSRDQESSRPNSLSMRLRLVDEEVRTPDEKELTNALWTMTFYENGSGNEFTELHNAIGLINYYEEWHSEHDDISDSPEACHARANLDSQTFALLQEMALAGKLPVVFRLHASRIAYGWEPDGSGKVWDVKAHKNAVISKIEIISNFVKPPESERGEKEIDSFWVEPPKESPELVAMRGMAKSIERINTNLMWVVGFLALTAAVVIFR